MYVNIYACMHTYIRTYIHTYINTIKLNVIDRISKINKTFFHVKTSSRSRIVPYGETSQQTQRQMRRKLNLLFTIFQTCPRNETTNLKHL